MTGERVEGVGSWNEVGGKERTGHTSGALRAVQVAAAVGELGWWASRCSAMGEGRKETAGVWQHIIILTQVFALRGAELEHSPLAFIHQYFLKRWLYHMRTKPISADGQAQWKQKTASWYE